MDPREHSAAYAAALSAGRYCFVVMPFDELWGVYDAAMKPGIEAAGLRALRADDVPGGGYDLLEKVHTLIRQASVLVADITHAKANVAYELGFARALGKATILVTQDLSSVPSDLRGLEVIPYEETREGCEALKTKLERTLRTYVASNAALLRDMLEPPTPAPCYILAQPKPPPPELAKILAELDRMRTYGDCIGIAGLFRAFGLLFGERLAPELLDALSVPPKLVGEPNNLFVIGGPKVNKWTAELLPRIQRGRPPDWTFAPTASGGNEGDEGDRMILRGVLGDRPWVWPDSSEALPASTDYGIIVRAPHPKSSERMVTVLAGRRSIGTGAACLAATTSTLIESVQRKLSVPLADKSRTIWVLVRGESQGEDRHMTSEGVTVVDAGTYDPGA